MPPKGRPGSSHSSRPVPHSSSGSGGSHPPSHSSSHSSFGGSHHSAPPPPSHSPSHSSFGGSHHSAPPPPPSHSPSHSSFGGSHHPAPPPPPSHSPSHSSFGSSHHPAPPHTGYGFHAPPPPPPPHSYSGSSYSAPPPPPPQGYGTYDHDPPQRRHPNAYPGYYDSRYRSSYQDPYRGCVPVGCGRYIGCAMLLALLLIIGAIIVLIEKGNLLHQHPDTNSAYSASDSYHHDDIYVPKLERDVPWSDEFGSYYDKETDCYFFLNVDMDPPIWQYWYEGISSEYGEEYGWMEWDSKELRWYVMTGKESWEPLPEDKYEKRLWHFDY